MDRLKISTLWGVVLWGLLVWQPAQAATLPNIHLEGSNGLLRAGDTITVSIQIDSGGRLINAVDLHVLFSPLYLQVLRIDQAQSVWTLWPEQPSWNNTTGTVALVAGRPHGLIAINATVATIVFRALGTTLTQVVADSGHSAVYLNDGQGTKVNVTGEKLDLALADSLVPAVQLLDSTSPRPDQWTHTNAIHIDWAVQPDTQYSYRLSQNVTDVPNDSPDSKVGTVDYGNLTSGVYFFSIQRRQGGGDWSRVSQYRFLLDQEPPEALQLVPLTAAQTGGQPAISWSASDAVSGVLSSRLKIGNRDLGLVASPVTLRTAWAGKTLTITVFDGAGNSQSASWQVPGRTINWSIWFMLGGSLVSAALIIVVINRRK